MGTTTRALFAVGSVVPWAVVEAWRLEVEVEGDADDGGDAAALWARVTAGDGARLTCRNAAACYHKPTLTGGRHLLGGSWFWRPQPTG